MPHICHEITVTVEPLSSPPEPPGAQAQSLGNSFPLTFVCVRQVRLRDLCSYQQGQSLYPGQSGGVSGAAFMRALRFATGCRGYPAQPHLRAGRMVSGDASPRPNLTCCRPCPPWRSMPCTLPQRSLPCLPGGCPRPARRWRPGPSWGQREHQAQAQAHAVLPSPLRRSLGHGQQEALSVSRRWLSPASSAASTSAVAVRCPQASCPLAGLRNPGHQPPGVCRCSACRGASQCCWHRHPGWHLVSFCQPQKQLVVQVRPRLPSPACVLESQALVLQALQASASVLYQLGVLPPVRVPALVPLNSHSAR